MKQSIIFLVISVVLASAVMPTYSQEVLPEVTVVAVNYKYLKMVGDKETAVPVKRLERAAAAYDIKSADYYEDEYDTYFVSFYLPEGEILAAYDKDGKLIRTAEKYKNVKLPSAVAKAVTERFPKWRISKDVYVVNYYGEGGATKRYKLLLENGNKRLRIKTDDQGTIY